MSDSTGITNGWHLRKEISVGHILTTLTVAGAAFLWMAELEKRVERNAVMVQAIGERVTRTEDRTERQLERIHNALVRIEAKLDDKVDKPPR